MLESVGGIQSDLRCTRPASNDSGNIGFLEYINLDSFRDFWELSNKGTHAFSNSNLYQGEVRKAAMIVMNLILTGTIRAAEFLCESV